MLQTAKQYNQACIEAGTRRLLLESPGLYNPEEVVPCPLQGLDSERHETHCILCGETLAAGQHPETGTLTQGDLDNFSGDWFASYVEEFGPQFD